MPNLTEQAQWEAGIYQLELTDPVVGGQDGVDNLPHKLLANRTLYLKQQLDRLSIMGADLATVGGVLTLPDSGGYFVVTGAEPLTQISARAAGECVRLRWASARAIQHNPAQLALPDARSFTVHPDELTEWISDGGGIWRPLSKRDAVGKLDMCGGATAPAGWLLCDGSAVSRTLYAGLFAYLGTTWGVGDGATTFNLPDMRSRSPIGAGQGAGLTNRDLAATGGEEAHADTVQETASHAHNVMAYGGGTNSPTQHYVMTGTDQTSQGNLGAWLSQFIASVGGGAAHNTMHPYAAVTFIIKT